MQKRDSLLPIYLRRREIRLNMNKFPCYSLLQGLPAIGAYLTTGVSVFQCSARLSVNACEDDICESFVLIPLEQQAFETRRMSFTHDTNAFVFLHLKPSSKNFGDRCTTRQRLGQNYTVHTLQVLYRERQSLHAEASAMIRYSRDICRPNMGR